MSRKGSPIHHDNGTLHPEEEGIAPSRIEDHKGMDGRTKGEAASQQGGAPNSKSRLLAAPPDFARRSVGVLVTLAEVAVVAAFALFLLTGGVVNIEEQYLRPHLQSYEFTKDRQDQEVTYYSRTCTPQDVSTLSSRDLYLTNASNPRHAYDTFLRHGAVVFPSVLSRDTAARLRDFVIAKNLAQKPGESEFLHSPMHRWVVELGFDEDPVVAKALAEISSNRLFRSSLAKIFGSPDAALVEFNAITSEHGCRNQSWHADGTEDRSPLLYGRSFAPTHLMLTPLQDTTPEMGGTALCPGTHYCREVTAGACDGPHQIAALTHPDRDHWPAGDGLLMTTNTYHRGTAFVDPDASHRYRVVLVTTVSPIPRKRYETRQLSHGLSFSLKWYMWGQTLNDLARGLVRRPWADLTSLGLYKRHGGNWGYDFVTGLVQRMDSADCCTLSNDALHDFVKSGGVRWLPKFLHGQYSLETSFDQGVTWYQYLADTIRRCHEFTRTLHRFAVVAYFCTMAARYLHQSHRTRNSGTSAAPSALHRVLLGYASLYVLSRWMRATIVSQAAWTRNIRAGSKDVVTFPFQPSHYDGPATFPTSHDVLIGSRLDSKHLGMYADFLQYHPGNTLWHDAISRRLEWLPQYPALPRGLQLDLARGIVDDVVEAKASRFLYQVPASGKWIVLDRGAAENLTSQELFLRSNPVLQCLDREIRFLRSNCVYGPLRDTKLCRLDSSLVISLLDRIRHSSLRRVLASRDQGVPPLPTTARRISFQPRRSCCFRTLTTVRAETQIPSLTRKEKDKTRDSPVPLEGDIVQVLHGATIDDESGSIVPAWWLGKVVTVHPLGAFHVWLEASDAIEPFGATLVCSVVDDACMDTAEQYEGWMRSANGTYTNEYESELEIYEADDSDVDELGDESDE